MTAIVRKSAYFYLTHVLTFSIPGLGELILGRRIEMLSMMVVWVPIWLSSSVLWSERMESYAFLRTLPVSDREIVRIKFGLALGFGIIYWLILSAYAALLLGSAPEYGPAMALITLNCALSLILAGAWYLVSWRFGINVLTASVMSFVVAGVILGGMTMGMGYRGRIWQLGISLGSRLVENPWIYQVLPVAAALAAYYGLMRAAVRVKEQSEASLKP